MESLILSGEDREKYSSTGNSVGALIDDKLIVYEFDILRSTKMEHLAKVCFCKKRNYFLNLVFYTFAIICLLRVLYFNINFFEYIILLSIFICANILAFTVKVMHYTFIIVRFNLTFTEIKIKKHQVKDAEELLEQVNKKLQDRGELFTKEKFNIPLK